VARVVIGTDAGGGTPWLLIPGAPAVRQRCALEPSAGPQTKPNWRPSIGPRVRLVEAGLMNPALHLGVALQLDGVSKALRRGGGVCARGEEEDGGREGAERGRR